MVVQLLHTTNPQKEHSLSEWRRLCFCVNMLHTTQAEKVHHIFRKGASLFSVQPFLYTSQTEGAFISMKSGGSVSLVRTVVDT